jgi:3'-phosphoadenosine 5'-phosphosulfate sulfotransferase (PAPS reductase)/FAD synthetase
MSSDAENPYLITGPALISFSGGRTSAYMLHEILKAHDGQLPPDVVVAFANTGKEREETLRFVHECGVRWNVKIRWVEWRPDNKESKYAAFEYDRRIRSALSGAAPQAVEDAR